MNTNTPNIRRPLATAALLLTLFMSELACDSAEPVTPKPVAVHILPPTVADTLTVDPDNPKPTPIKPIVKLPNPQLPD